MRINWLFKTPFLFLPLVFGFWVLPARFLCAQTAFDAFYDTVNQVFEQSRDAIVRVKAIQGDGALTTYGTGFYIDGNGTILTAAAILGPSDEIKVEANGLTLTAVVLARDNRSGVALLRVQAGKTPYLIMGDSSELKTASPLIGLGYPLNLPVAPICGMITGFDSQYLSHYFCTTHLRTSMAISPGQIGGPVLNTHGELVGMIVVAADERKFTYALPLKAIQKVLTEIAMHGEVRYGWLGVWVSNATSPETAAPTNFNQPVSQVMISKISDHTPAASSGLQIGDKVLRIGQREIHQPSDIIDASFFATVGEKMDVLVQRDGQLCSFSLVVGERPQAMPGVFIPKLNPPAPQVLPNANEDKPTPDAMSVSAPGTNP